jgi:hypothetical protein
MDEIVYVDFDFICHLQLMMHVTCPKFKITKGFLGAYDVSK